MRLPIEDKGDMPYHHVWEKAIKGDAVLDQVLAALPSPRLGTATPFLIDPLWPC
jgi:hypothetical protein